jgi:hypothetical protein
MHSIIATVIRDVLIFVAPIILGCVITDAINVGVDVALAVSGRTRSRRI